jgi:1-acyl-sn-glycerol-3-phosphate acyltransferase
MSDTRTPSRTPSRPSGRAGDGLGRLGGDDDEHRAVREALGELRQEIRTRFRREPEPLPASEARDWQRSLSDLPRRFSTLGMRERSGAIDEFGMDESALAGARPLLDLLFDRYWRVDTAGGFHLPETGPCLLVANRSGLLPWDGLMIAHAVERLGVGAGRPRFTVADWLVTLPFVQARLARLGGVRACRENVDRLLDSGRTVTVFPEGVKGAAKPFGERYRLQRFGRGGVVRTALERRVPLIPVGVVGAEEAHPILYKATTPARVLGLPFLPVTPTFPLLGPVGALPLPSQWLILFGEPMPLDGLAPDAAGDELLLARLTEDLRARVQALVDEGLRARASVWSLGPAGPREG